jgi:DNA-binding transcriptional ArsR family regulator
MATVATRPEDCDRIVQVLKAMAHPLRLRIVAILCRGQHNVSELAAELEANQAIVSQQLRILRMSRLVEATRKDGFSVYSLAEPHLVNLIKCVENCCSV